MARRTPNNPRRPRQVPRRPPQRNRLHRYPRPPGRHRQSLPLPHRGPLHPLDHRRRPSRPRRASHSRTGPPRRRAQASAPRHHRRSRSRQDHLPPPHRITKCATSDATAARLPILIRIAELAEHVRACRHRREGPTVAAAPGWLPHFLAARSAEFDWGLDAAFFERKLKSGESGRPARRPGRSPQPHRARSHGPPAGERHATPTTNAASW
jgi:hypothetical protein